MIRVTSYCNPADYTMARHFLGPAVPKVHDTIVAKDSYSTWEGILGVVVIPTKAGGRAEESGCEWALREIRGQMPRLRCASLGMTNGARFPPNRSQADGDRSSTATLLSYTPSRRGAVLPKEYRQETTFADDTDRRMFPEALESIVAGEGDRGVRPFLIFIYRATYRWSWFRP
jgi:hypothetical protein